MKQPQKRVNFSATTGWYAKTETQLFRAAYDQESITGPIPDTLFAVSNLFADPKYKLYVSHSSQTLKTHPVYINTLFATEAKGSGGF